MLLLHTAWGGRKILLTSKHIQNKVHVSGQDLYALHTGYGPDGDKLVAVHLWHEVQVLGQVFPEITERQKWMGWHYVSLNLEKILFKSRAWPGKAELQLLLERLP